MGLQTSDLVMVALGVSGDTPPIALQPKLVDGIHLRWAFPRARGFPWYGYYLFRRPHEPRGERCLEQDLAGRAPGTQLGTSVPTALGVLSSSEPLVLTEVVAPAGRPEISLDRHSTLRLDLPDGEPAFRVRVRVVFLQSGEQQECVDFRRLRPDFVPSPLVINKVTFAGKGPRGEDLPRLRIVTPPGGTRLDLALEAGATLEVSLPVATRTVRIDATGESGASLVEALDDAGRVVVSEKPVLDPNKPATVELKAAAEFRRVRLRTPSGVLLLHRFCWLTAARAVSIPVTAYDGPMVVGRATLAGRPGATAETQLTFDRITAVDIGGGPAVLADLCAQIVPDAAFKSWQPVPNCPQPLLFPITHPDYPLASRPVNVAVAEAAALQRVVYGSTAPLAGANFASLHENLESLVKGGPPGPPALAMAAPERAARNVGGVPTPAAPGLDAPSVPSLHPLDLVLLGSLQPAVAQMVGLYWADGTANPSTHYDYLVVADHRNVSTGKATVLIDYIERNGYADVDAWIVFDRSMMPPAAPLAAPAGVRAFALPGGTFRAAGGVNANVVEADGNVGLTWPRPYDAQGFLRPEQPVLYHVWRDDQGNGAAPRPSSQATALVTDGGPLLAARAPGVPQESPQHPADWPPFSLAALDFGLREGWYGYQINAIDIFGRFSARSAFAEWRQWVPVPDPKPWYYIDPPADRIVHATSVRVLDRLPPPPPAFVEAWVLDPADPIVVRDAALDAWRRLPNGQQHTVIGLRVRWRWIVAQQRQAPDTREFRIYWNAGTTPPDNWQQAANWQLRGHVTPYASNVTVAANGDRSYDVFLPVTIGQGPFAAGVPLNPTRADPLQYANVTVTAADDAAHAQDTWPGAGPFAGRTGNESRAASPSRVYRVLRDPPPSPQPVVDSGRVYATPADWHARSYYTFRWRPQPSLFTHVMRAMDESVFAADWALRPRNPALQPNDAARFPDPTAEPTWTAEKRQLVCDAINTLNAIPKTDVGRVRALAAYSALSDDALRVLTNMPGCEKAFVQLTMRALDAADPANADRRGPDDPANYVRRSALRAYIDTLDGRALNRYLYRAVYVDAAQNRSDMGPIGTPVRLPNVVPPRAPAITKVTGGERRITVAWASNRESDLLEYRIFKTDRKDAADDIRRMTQVAVVAAASDPAARPAAVEWTDQPVPGLTDFYYRVVAVDRPDPVDPRGGGGNMSEPSAIARGRATQPAPSRPVVQAAWNGTHTSVQVNWQLNDPFLVPRLERRAGEGTPWAVAGGALAAGTQSAVDVPPDPASAYEYRVRVRDHVGQQATSEPVTAV